MHTLDIRESKSSLAGVRMAAAVWGVGIYQPTENVLPHLEDLPGQVANVLSRVDLPAIGGHHKPSGGGAGAAAVGGPTPANALPADAGAGGKGAAASGADATSGKAASFGTGGQARA